jgi:hypothetical protein
LFTKFSKIKIGFSVSFWVKINEWTRQYNYLIGRKGGLHIVRQGTTNSLSIGGPGGGGISTFLLCVCLFWNNDIYQRCIVASRNVNDGDWHHVVAVADEKDLLGGNHLATSLASTLIIFVSVLEGGQRYLYVDNFKFGTIKPPYDVTMADIKFGNIYIVDVFLRTENTTTHHSHD